MYKNFLLMLLTTLGLAGTGLAHAQFVVTATPTSLSFPTTSVGQTSAVQFITLSAPIRAPAGGGLTVTVTGPFARSGGTCVDNNTIFPCTLGFVFAPTAGGAQAGNATIAFSGSPNVVVPLSGASVALGPAPALGTPATILFGALLMALGLVFVRRI